MCCQIQNLLIKMIQKIKIPCLRLGYFSSKADWQYSQDINTNIKAHNIHSAYQVMIQVSVKQYSPTSTKRSSIFRLFTTCTRRWMTIIWTSATKNYCIKCIGSIFSHMSSCTVQTTLRGKLMENVYLESSSPQLLELIKNDYEKLKMKIPKEIPKPISKSVPKPV